MRLAAYVIVGGSMLLGGSILLFGSSAEHLRVFGAVVAVAGAVLAWRRGIGAAGWAAVGVVAALGIAASLLYVREDVACMYCYHRSEGYPWGFVHAGFTHEDMPTVERAHQIMAEQPGIAPRRFDTFHFLLDAVFWASAAYPFAAAIQGFVAKRSGRTNTATRPSSTIARSYSSKSG